MFPLVRPQNNVTHSTMINGQAYADFANCAKNGGDESMMFLRERMEENRKIICLRKAIRVSYYFQDLW